MRRGGVLPITSTLPTETGAVPGSRSLLAMLLALGLRHQRRTDHAAPRLDAPLNTAAGGPARRAVSGPGVLAVMTDQGGPRRGPVGVPRPCVGVVSPLFVAGGPPCGRARRSGHRRQLARQPRPEDPSRSPALGDLPLVTVAPATSGPEPGAERPRAITSLVAARVPGIRANRIRIARLGIDLAIVRGGRA